MLIIPSVKAFQEIKYKEFYVPTIQALQKLGGSATKKAVVQKIIELNDIADEVQNLKTKNQRDPKIDNMIAWARQYLKVAGYIKNDSPWGQWELSDEAKILNLENQLVIEQVIDQVILANTAKTSVVSEDTEIIGQQPDEWRTELLNVLQQFKPAKFELFSRRLVSAMGVDIDEKKGIQHSNDGGIDGYGYLISDDFRTSQIAIQAKRWQNNVGREEIQKFVGALNSNYKEADYGIFITTSDFNKNAIAAARQSTKPITLINGEKLLDLIAKYELYVTPIITYTLDDFYLTEE